MYVTLKFKFFSFESSDPLMIMYYECVRVFLALAHEPGQSIL